MGTHKLVLDDDFEEDFSLIAIHCKSTSKASRKIKTVRVTRLAKIYPVKIPSFTTQGA